MKNSPLRSAGGLQDWLRYQDIAKAGRPTSLTGEAIVQLGSLFTQMFPDDLEMFSKTPEIKADDRKPEVREITIEPPTFDKVKIEDIGGERKLPNFLEIPDRPSIKNETKPVVTEPIITEYKDPTEGITGDLMQPGGIFTFNPNQLPEEQPSDYRYTPRGSFAPGFPRLDEKTLSAFEKLKYIRKGSEDTPLHRISHVINSPFVKTDKVGYRYMKRAVIPEYAQGSLGSAAAEGYNLAIDKYNYNEAVKEDFDNLLEEETEGLIIEQDFTGKEFQQDFLEFGQREKLKVANAVAEYAKGNISKIELENIKLEAKSAVDNFAAAGNNLKVLRSDFLKQVENGTIDIGASKKQHADFLNTLLKSPDNLTIKNINGADYVVGKTMKGENLQIPISKLADGTASFGLNPKADLSSISSNALKIVQNLPKKEGRTQFGVGTSTASLEDAEKASMSYFKNLLSKDENLLRSVVSQTAGLGYDQFEEAMGEDKQADMTEMINDASSYLFKNYIAPVYGQETTTRKFDTTEKQYRPTAGEREVQRIKALFDSKGNITKNNYKEFLTLVPGFEKNYRSIIKDGKLQIGKGKDLVANIDLSNPTLAKQQLANLAGVTGYSGPTYDATSLIQKYSK